MEKRNKKINMMSNKELQDKIGYCVANNQQNSRYYKHLLAEQSKRKSVKEAK